MRRLFCIDDEIKDSIELEDRPLEVFPTVDPDQVLWDNIGFSISERQLRTAIAVLVQVVCTVLSIVITLWIENFKSNITVTECSGEEITRTQAYKEQSFLSLIKLVAAKKEQGILSNEKILEIESSLELSDKMICYCKKLTNNGYYPWMIKSVEWD